MTIQEAYNNWSSTYDADANLTRDLDQQVTTSLLGDRRFESIIEVGCGTGKNTSLLSRIGGKVFAIDFSEGMVAFAKEKVSFTNVTFVLTDVSRPWPCRDHSADLVVCNLVLEHIENIGFVFSEAARTLESHGSFFVCELHPCRQYEGKKATFQREDRKIMIPSFVHHLSDFLGAAERNALTLEKIDEWWHEKDRDAPPRLVSFSFVK
ncbi:MAG: class I SAM-dependent methyltransferase [Bacteroidota bacterium]